MAATTRENMDNMDSTMDSNNSADKRVYTKRKWNKPSKKFSQRGEKESMKVYRKRQTRGLTEREEIETLRSLYEDFDSSAVKTFKDFPLSTKTQLGLQEAGYVTPTEIQKEAVGLALRGLDILGAAKTGSGKTLAFLIPVLEKLYCEMWARDYGIGALIITPTRELAYQIFEVLKKIGVHHDFSAGLVIGGKDLKFESKRMGSCNIVICTPGRLLQHMDENPLFDATHLQILVLDEADRILDLGFQQTVNAIIENIPLERQTLLFSATQTKSVKDLARLSLKDPAYVSVHEHAKFTTPEGLTQCVRFGIEFLKDGCCTNFNILSRMSEWVADVIYYKRTYVVCELHNKLNLLWSFIRNHLKQKILVFLSSCKQVKYVYRAFCRMRPGMTILELHGNMFQLKRMAVYDEFCRKQSAVLIATDIAARGLDFPAVNWVIQFDCPEDVSTYIHRAGRTARFQKDGEALLILLPSEESMAEQLTNSKIPISKIQVNPRMFMNVQKKLEAMCARDVALKECAQRCFTAYLKSVFLMKDKGVFDVTKLDLDAFARSLGLAMAPRVRFLQKHMKELEAKEAKQKKINEKKEAKERSMNKSHAEQDFSTAPVTPIRGPDTKAFEFDVSGDESEDDIFTVKRTVTYNSDDDDKEIALEEVGRKKKQKPVTKAAAAKKLLKKKVVPNKKVVFDEEGEAVEGINTQKAEVIRELLKEEKTPCGIDLEISKKILEEEDKFDKQRYRERVKAMHKMKRLKMRQERKEQSGEAVAELGVGGGSEEESEEEEDDEEESSGTEGNSGVAGPSSAASSSEDDELPQRRKRPAGQASKQPAAKKKLARKQPLYANSDSEEEDDELAPMDTGLDLKDDEALALHMLSKR